MLDKTISSAGWASLLPIMVENQDPYKFFFESFMITIDRQMQ